MGGGTQVGQVAIGAISETDRHNIRGEHISVDTTPLVGEQQLADAVRACARLPCAKALALAGPRGAQPGGTAGGVVEHGGKRPGSGGSSGDGSGAGGGDDGDGGVGYGEVQY